MKKITVIAAAAALAASVFTGCGKYVYGINVPKEYKDFFDYSFADYKVKEKPKTHNSLNSVGYRHWDITFTDKSGQKHVVNLNGFGYVDDSVRSYSSEELMCDCVVEFTAVKAGCTAALFDFCQNVMESALGFTFYCDENTKNAISMQSGDAEYLLYVDQVDIPQNMTHEQLKKVIDPTTGIKVSDYDLKEHTADTDRYVTFNILLDENTEPYAYKEQIDKLCDAFVSYTGDPQHYSFLLNQRKPEGGVETLYDRSAAYGKTINVTEGSKNENLYNLITEIRKGRKDNT